MDKTPANPSSTNSLKPNPFKELPESDAKAPDKIRKQVIGSYNLLNGIFKIIDLYLGGFFNAIGGMIKLNTQSKEGIEHEANKKDEK